MNNVEIRLHRITRDVLRRSYPDAVVEVEQTSPSLVKVLVVYPFAYSAKRQMEYGLTTIFALLFEYFVVRKISVHAFFSSDDRVSFYIKIPKTPKPPAEVSQYFAQ